ncbi:odorant receptor 67a-like isoform X2 [Leptopilina boulardi]|nr:odorant receptor 67a-like isoform X2 [Leptopilina boulardi]
MGKKLNELFSIMTFAQFFLSTLALGVIIYQLAKVKLFTSKFFFMLFRLNNYLLEIYLLCWFGELMISESVDVAQKIYEINWPLFSTNSKKCLIIIMSRARIPIQLTAASIISLSFDTFFKIIKISYTAFNFLRNS